MSVDLKNTNFKKNQVLLSQKFNHKRASSQIDFKEVLRKKSENAMILNNM